MESFLRVDETLVGEVVVKPRQNIAAPRQEGQERGFHPRTRSTRFQGFEISTVCILGRPRPPSI